MTLSAEMLALEQLSEIRKALDDPEYCKRLSNAVAAAMSFCTKPETWPVFHRWLIASYDDPEQKDALLRLKREDFEMLILLSAAKIDPAGLLKLLHEEVVRQLINSEISGK